MQDLIPQMPKAKECLKLVDYLSKEALIQTPAPVCLGVGSTNIARPR